jgi:hypothetical protein
MSYNWNEIASMLEVVEKCTGHTGKLSNLQALALYKLLAINADIKADAAAEVKSSESTNGSDHQVDLNFGAPRSVPATELGGDTTTQVDRRI